MRTRDIIAVSVILGFCFLFIMALVTRILLHKHSKPTTEDIPITDGSGDQHYQFSHISNACKRLFTPRQEYPKGQWVPTLSGMIKAGDEGLFPSALFANLQAHPGELSLQSLYEIFVEELRTQSMSDRSAYSGEFARFLSSTRRTVSGPKRTQSISHRATSRGRADASNGRPRKSLDLSVAERGLGRGISMKRPTPILVSMNDGLPDLMKEKSRQMSWSRDGQIALSRYGSIGIKVTPGELAALSIILGCQIAVGGKSEYIPHKKGAFHISFSSSVTEDGKHQITLRQHKRNTTHLPARGSGFSPLFSKHIAGGSLPYAQDNRCVQSILVNNLTLKAVQSGMPVCLHDPSFETRQSRYVSMLPSSREFKFHIASTIQNPQPSNPVVDAISALPFMGGLVPLASIPLIKTVQFVACGGLAPSRLLQRLEGLVDKVNRQAPHLKIFGPLYETKNLAILYRERERLGRLAKGTGVADTIADKASRMQRYVTLLERLMALVPDMKPRDILAAVQKATKEELEHAYLDAVAAYRTSPSRSSSVVDSHGCPESDARSKRASTSSQGSGHRSNRSSSASIITFVSPVSSGDAQTQTLAKQVERLLKAELPLSVESIATVARLVIAAWTLSVEPVAWEDGEAGFRVPELEKLPEKMVMC